MIGKLVTRYRRIELITIEERRQRGGCYRQREQGRFRPPLIVRLGAVIRLQPEQQQGDSGDEDAEASENQQEVNDENRNIPYYPAVFDPGKAIHHDKEQGEGLRRCSRRT